jgi:hypothetical protein
MTLEANKQLCRDYFKAFLARHLNVEITPRDPVMPRPARLW